MTAFQRREIVASSEAFLLGTAALLAMCLAVTPQSLWMDEAATAWLASSPTVSDFIAALSRIETSDPQMPLYVSYIWAWVKLWGTTELALRAANIPFGALFVMAIAWTGRRVFGLRYSWFVFALAPFVWYYMNEARAYLPTMACAAVSSAALLVYLTSSGKATPQTPWVCLVFLLLAYALNMLALFLVPAFVVIVGLTLSGDVEKRRVFLDDWRRPFLVCSPLFFLLSAYFSWTVLAGKGGQRGDPGIGNIAFVLYEFIGFSGLGPPRNELRADPSLSTVSEFSPWLLLGLLAWLAFVVVFHENFIRGPWKDLIRRLICGCLVSFLFFFAAASVTSFRFWGRHCAWLFALFVFICMGLMAQAREESPRSQRAGNVAVFLIALAWGLSDVRLILLAPYAKDDYRAAARIACSEATSTGRQVAWAADPTAARYYGVLLEATDPPSPWPVCGAGVSVANWTEGQVRHWQLVTESPTVLVLSKPDLYDKAGAWTALLHSANATKIAAPNTFEIWLFQAGLVHRDGPCRSRRVRSQIHRRAQLPDADGNLWESPQEQKSEVRSQKAEF